VHAWTPRVCTQWMFLRSRHIRYAMVGQSGRWLRAS